MKMMECKVVLLEVVEIIHSEHKEWDLSLPDSLVQDVSKHTLLTTSGILIY